MACRKNCTIHHVISFDLFILDVCLLVHSHVRKPALIRETQ